MQLACPIPKILLPVDGSDDSKRAVLFSGCLGSFLGKGLAGITLLRVIAGGYISRHLANVDYRAADLLKNSEVFRRVREEHVNQTIRPLLDDMEKVLRELGTDAAVTTLVTDGDAANEIIRVATEGNYTTIMMARRGITARRGAALGSVTNKVIYAAYGHTVYVVGYRTLERAACPIPRILVPVDGSPYSIKGLEHAACLAAGLKDALGGITLLRVINVALHMERLRMGIDPEIEAHDILDKGRQMLQEAGIREDLIQTKVRIGIPAEEIIGDIETEDYNLVIMGRKGRTALKEMLLGGVSSTVLQRCGNPTFAIVGGV
ncbi:MAG: universal stress protein [Thermodesulfobacteriota bacterium]